MPVHSWHAVKLVKRGKKKVWVDQIFSWRVSLHCCCILRVNLLVWKTWIESRASIFTACFKRCITSSRKKPSEVVVFSHFKRTTHQWTGTLQNSFVFSQSTQRIQMLQQCYTLTLIQCRSLRPGHPDTQSGNHERQTDTAYDINSDHNFCMAADVEFYCEHPPNTPLLPICTSCHDKIQQKGNIPNVYWGQCILYI